MTRDHQQHQRDQRQNRIVDRELRAHLVPETPLGFLAGPAARGREEHAADDARGEREDAPDQDDPAEVEQQLVDPDVPARGDLLVRLVHRAYSENGVEEPAEDDDR